jgi:hypothetical protein
MTLIVQSIDPNAVCIKGIEVLTSRGLVTLGESEPISYTQDKSGNLYIGSNGTVLLVSHKTALLDLSKVIKPATFSLVVEDDGEISLKATILGDISSPYIPEGEDREFQDVASIISVRGCEGALL